MKTYEISCAGWGVYLEEAETAVDALKQLQSKLSMLKDFRIHNNFLYHPEKQQWRFTAWEYNPNY